LSERGAGPQNDEREREGRRKPVDPGIRPHSSNQ
jgi:hypothetical protein